MVRLVLADDHQLVIDGLRALLGAVPDFEIVAEARNGKQLIELVGAVAVNVALVDIDMPIMSGLEAIQKLATSHPNLKCVALTMHNEKGMIQRVMQSGAAGYILKNADQHDLIDSVRRAAQGETVLSEEAKATLSGAARNIQTSYQNAALAVELTEREVEILRLIAQGFSNKEIGDKLFISHRTVDTHRTNLMKKLETHNIAGLIRFAMQAGYLT